MGWLDYLGDFFGVGEDGWGTFGELAGSAVDWLSDEDNAWFLKSLTDLAFEYPELDYDKLMEMAVNQARINSVDVNSPSGTVRWDIDPETGKRTVTQRYSEQVQPLFDMLVRQAGAPITADSYYRNPQGMGETMLGYLQDQWMTGHGLEPQGYTRPIFTREGVQFPATSGNPPDNTGGPPDNTGGNQNDFPDRYDNLRDRANWWMGRVNSDWWDRIGSHNPPEQIEGNEGDEEDGFNETLNELFDEFQVADGFREWAMANSDTIGRALGVAGGLAGWATGLPGLGRGLKALEQRWVDWQYANGYTLQNPADVPPSELDQWISDWENYGTDPEQSGIDEGDTTDRSGVSTGVGRGERTGPMVIEIRDGVTSGVTPPRDMGRGGTTGSYVWVPNPGSGSDDGDWVWVATNKN